MTAPDNCSTKVLLVGLQNQLVKTHCAPHSTPPTLLITYLWTLLYYSHSCTQQPVPTYYGCDRLLLRFGV